MRQDQERGKGYEYFAEHLAHRLDLVPKARNVVHLVLSSEYITDLALVLQLFACPKAAHTELRAIQVVSLKNVAIFQVQYSVTRLEADPSVCVY